MDALNVFLLLVESIKPVYIDEPIVRLFLLVCDFSINPSVGFPLNINKFDDFINDIDAGNRFLRLCSAIKSDPLIKEMIVECSKEEYCRVCSRLSELSGLDSPIENRKKIKEWVDEFASIKKMLHEYKTFKFNLTNLPLRVIFSHFLQFSLDHLDRPEFFCWPGYWMAGPGLDNEIVDLWGGHLSLFTDRDDKPGVYPRMIPGRGEEDLIDTLNNFYNSIPLFDLTRQWVLFEGAFTINYMWLAENYQAEQAKTWANRIFIDTYGISTDDIKLINQMI